MIKYLTHSIENLLNIAVEHRTSPTICPFSVESVLFAYCTAAPSWEFSSNCYNFEGKVLFHTLTLPGFFKAIKSAAKSANTNTNTNTGKRSGWRRGVEGAKTVGWVEKGRCPRTEGDLLCYNSLHGNLAENCSDAWFPRTGRLQSTKSGAVKWANHLSRPWQAYKCEYKYKYKYKCIWIYKYSGPTSWVYTQWPMPLLPLL